MYSTKRMIYYGILTAAGVALVLLSVFEVLENFWGGLGGGLAGVGAIRLFLGIKYRKDEKYAKKIDVEQKDERIIFISSKAKSWAYYVTILGVAVASLILRGFGLDEAAQTCFYVLYGMLIVYLVAFMILNRKY